MPVAIGVVPLPWRAHVKIFDMHVLRPNHNMCARIRSRGTLGAVGEVTKGASSPQTRDEAQIFFRRGTRHASAPRLARPWRAANNAG